MVSTLLTLLPVSCPLTTPHHYVNIHRSGVLTALAWHGATCNSSRLGSSQELCESRGGRPGHLVPNKPQVMVSVDVVEHHKIHLNSVEESS